MPIDDAFFTPSRIQRIKGELPRLIKYAEGGTIVHTTIPQDVISAGEQF
jgi:hypothetical protein